MQTLLINKKWEKVFGITDFLYLCLCKLKFYYIKINN